MARRVTVGVIIVAAALVVAGCGMSTTGTGGAATTASQSVGPAAPAAARAEQPAASAAAQPRAHISVFLLPAGAEFESVSLSLAAVSLLDADGKAASLKAVPAAPVKPRAFHLIAQGEVPPGKYGGLALQARDGEKDDSLTFAAGEPAVPMRLPDRLDLKFEPMELRADKWHIVVVTLDLADVRPGEEVAIAARRFAAGALSADEASGLKGEVAPAASLARVYALWAETGVPLAMTQPDPFSGEYVFAGLPPGQYCLRMTAAGCQPYQGPQEPIALAPGKTANAPAVTLLPVESSTVK